MISRSTTKVKGKVTVVVRDAKTGKVLQVIARENIITDRGREFVAEAITGYPPWVMLGWYMDIGTGVCTPTATDTDLCSPIIESTVRDETTYYFRRWWKSVSHYRTQNTVVFHARWLPEDANNYSICEEILFIAHTEVVGNLRDQSRWASPEPLSNITSAIGARVVQHGAFSCVAKTPSILLDIYVSITFT